MISQRIQGGVSIGSTDPNVARLWVRRHVCEEGHLTLTSSWEPQTAELERLKAGAPVLLHILGPHHPPVCVEVGDVPEEAVPAAPDVTLIGVMAVTPDRCYVVQCNDSIESVHASKQEAEVIMKAGKEAYERLKTVDRLTVPQYWRINEFPFKFDGNL
jgi:hypothetical protein